MSMIRVAAAAVVLLAGSASAEDLIRLNTFPTARSLPFFVGVEKGFFTQQGIKLEFEFTESSRAQREGLANGKFEVVHSAVDNALAMIETAKVDVVIVSGGDGGTNEFIIGKGLSSYADVRGKALVTDAPNTAYALQAKKILLKHGLKDGVDYRINAVGAGPFRLKAMLEGGDNAAAIMNLPFSAQAIEAGMKSLGRTVDLLGPYQAGGAFVLRAWAKAHPNVLERYLAGYITSLRWVLDKANRDEAIALLMSKRNLSRSLAERSYDLMIEPGFGFNPDARLSTEGFDNVLKLRQEVEGGPAPDPAKYLDLSYYDRALKLVAR
jgi:ABC-type nitrate/sulfonate/bicarbonate transport system substrate-binding protein